MTVYLLDENVLRELHPKGDVRGRRWLATIDDAQVRISALTFFEKRRGWERRRRKEPELAAGMLSTIDALEAAYAGRIVPIDGPIVAEWARLLGAKDKNQRDRALAATARVHGFVLVTRNVADMAGCDVDVLNPFQMDPTIERV